MKVLAILVTYNAIRWIEQCIESLVHSSMTVDIFIKDNGSTDGTVSYIEKHYSKFIARLVVGGNIGFGKANNLGLEYALQNGYDYVYLINQDAWVMNDTLSKLIRIHKDNNEFGILSPLQYQSDLRHLDSNFASGTCSYNQNKSLLSDLFNNDIKDVYEVPMVMASHWLISIDCINKVGGFSPAFQLYGEDDNYAQRTRFKQFKIGIVPSAKAVHDRGERTTTKARNIKIANASVLKNLLDPMLSNKRRLGLILKNTFINTCRYKSFIPLYYLFELVCKCKYLSSLYYCSKQSECAYLNIDSS